MGALFAEIGDLVFTLVISYISAIECLYVVRHLIHYSCNHDVNEGSDSSENVSQLQDSLLKQLENAKNREALAGTQVMRDGVPYKDGFRRDVQQVLIDQLKEQLKDKELSDFRRQELGNELAKQVKIAENIRKELADAEAIYQRQLKQEGKTLAKELLEEQRQREREKLAKIEAEEQARKLMEEEKQRESERKKNKEERVEKEAELKEKVDEENASRLIELKKQKEYEQRILEECESAQKLKEEAHKQQEMFEVEESAHRVFEKEKSIEEKQAAEELAGELATKNLLTIEHQLEEQLREAESKAELTEKKRQLIDSSKKRNLNKNESNERKETELLRKILDANEQLGEESDEEQFFKLMQYERGQEAKQKRIEENALLFLEAEKEMAELQSKMLNVVEKKAFRGSLDSGPPTPIVEEPCIKWSYLPLSGGETSYSTVKTQLAQDLHEPHSVRTKPLIFPGVSDDASSIEPSSSLQSSFSTQPSEDITTGTDSQYSYQERQEPDGEDNNLIYQQYSDDYLRSLDGIKQRPLMREDSFGRRRAFKKRRSSNSSNSSRESRQSHDEELKMFTSLEEEEIKYTGDSEFTPIRYNTETTLKVKGHHSFHKRSPAKDMRHGDDSLRSSLERLGEETINPWGEVKLEHYKNTEFWKKEKTISIDEENEFEKPTSSGEVAYDTAITFPSACLFEKATQEQNQQVLSALQKHSAQKSIQEGKSAEQINIQEESGRGDNTNFQTCRTKEKEATSIKSSTSPHLRLSPRKKEQNKNSFSSAQNTPIINVQTQLDFGPWRDEYGLVMEGLSDFYDFTASINPSRSRSASRNVSPANTAPNTPLPKDVSFQLKIAHDKINEKTIIEIYDDTENFSSNEFKKDSTEKFIDSLTSNEVPIEQKIYDSEAIETKIEINLKNIANDPSSTFREASLAPLVNIIENIAITEDSNLAHSESSDTVMNTLVSSLRSQQSNRSRTRSKSPLPTPDNLKRSVENRRYKMIKHNEDILEKLIESKLLPELNPSEEKHDKYSEEKNEASEMEINSQKETNLLVQLLQVDKRRSRSKSPMHLPTSENISKDLEKRRSKLIARTDELIKHLEERSLNSESPTIAVERMYEFESSEQTKKTVSYNEECGCTREEIDLLVQSLRDACSTTVSKSPILIKEDNTNKVTRFYSFHNADHIETSQYLDITSVPTISVDFSEVESIPKYSSIMEHTEDCSRDEMNLLVQSLRTVRSKSTSKTPLLLLDSELMHNRIKRGTTPEPCAISKVEFMADRSKHSRSKSPSLSHSYTPSRSLPSQPGEYNYFHILLNLEGSNKKTLSISSEEEESIQLADRQRQLDEQALEKLRNASEEMELRILSSLSLDREKLSEQQSQDYISGLPLNDRAKILKKFPTTPEYDRSISEQVRDNERIKQERLKKGFKRSTYVGESMDLDSEFEPLRREAARFQRSRSPSPTISTIKSFTAQRNLEEKRKIQDFILQELSTNSTIVNKEYKSTGAIPKRDRLSSSEIEMDVGNAEHINKERFSNNSTQNFGEMRRRNAKFKRSASISRSPLRENQKEELKSIEDKILDELSADSLKFQELSRRINTDVFDNDCRSSDSALMKVPEILVQLKADEDIEPEEYHHCRRFSLAQKELQQQFTADDYIFIQQVEVRTRSGSRTWLREDFYTESVEDFLKKDKKSTKSSAEKEIVKISSHRDNIIHEATENIAKEVAAADAGEDYSNASDDDRQTVVEVDDDEIDEDISDFNERGPAEESYHEISECEEADREVDRYTGREASDWNPVVDVTDIIRDENQIINFEEDEGAVGKFSSSSYDSDSFAIDQIYGEAIKNRKQSGILREYDSILRQMSSSSDMDEQYLLWSKKNNKKTAKNIEFNTKFLNNERKEYEMRYLGDSDTVTRQSARLYSHYGYRPILRVKCLEDDLKVEPNYKPKKEYIWRKNFNQDDVIKEDKEITLESFYAQGEKCQIEVEKKEENQGEDINGKEITDQVNALGGERLILDNLSLAEQGCGPDKYLDSEIFLKEKSAEEKQKSFEKPKKTKTKKKYHKESKANLEETINKEDEEAYDNQVYYRRSSSIQMDRDSPKWKSRSRRSSKTSLTNEDSQGLFSRRSSVICSENIGYIMEEFTDAVKEITRSKRVKKCKKDIINDIPIVSSVITPESFSANILSTISQQHSVCTTPASTESDIILSIGELEETATNSSTTRGSSPSGNLSQTSSIATATPVDTFDMVKDANFYPLF